MLTPLINLVKAVNDNKSDKAYMPIIYLPLFVIAVVIDLSVPLVIGKLLNSIQESKSAEELFSNALFYLCCYLLLKIIFWLPHGIGRVLERKFAFYVEAESLKSIFNKLIKIPLSWHTDEQSGDIIDKAKKSSKSLFHFTEQGFINFYIFVRMLIAFSFLLYINVFTGLIAIIFSSCTLFLILRLDKILFKKYKILNIFSNKISASFFDYISNINSVVTLSLQKKVEKDLIAKIYAPKKTYFSQTYIHELKWCITSILAATMLATCLITYAYFEMQTSSVILAGTFYSLFEYLQKIEIAFYNFAFHYGTIVERSADIENAKPIHEAYLNLHKEKTDNCINWNQIKISNLNFSYSDNKDKSSISNVSLNINKGEKIAFIGESGSGKSTTLKLLAGIYEPNSLSVSIDNNYEKRDFNFLRKQSLLIPQEPEIFASTIRYNVSLEDGINFDSKITKAIELANFDSVLKNLPQGLDTNISEKGVNLSGGEKQRLALARGIFFSKNSNLLLLDEPTSSVDKPNEEEIYKNLIESYSDKTIIAALHNTNLLYLFDQIYKFDSGELSIYSK